MNIKNKGVVIVILIILLTCSGLGIAAFTMYFTKKCGEKFSKPSSSSPLPSPSYKIYTVYPCNKKCKEIPIPKSNPTNATSNQIVKGGLITNLTYAPSIYHPHILVKNDTNNPSSYICNDVNGNGHWEISNDLDNPYGGKIKYQCILTK